MTDKPIYMAHCDHALPQAASQLHGICIFCYRDRLGAAHRDLAAALAAVRDADIWPPTVDNRIDLRESFYEWHSRHALIIALAAQGEANEEIEEITDCPIHGITKGTNVCPRC